MPETPNFNMSSETLDVESKENEMIAVKPIQVERIAGGEIQREIQLRNAKMNAYRALSLQSQRTKSGRGTKANAWTEFIA